MLPFSDKVAGVIECCFKKKKKTFKWCEIKKKKLAKLLINEVLHPTPSQSTPNWSG